MPRIEAKNTVISSKKVYRGFKTIDFCSARHFTYIPNRPLQNILIDFESMEGLNKNI